MTVENFLILLTVFATLTGVFTEALKKALDGTTVNIASNLIALVSAVVVGGGGTTIYYVVNGYDFTVTNIICIVLMMFANWIGAMVGYDKIKQVITQFKTK